MSSGLGGVCIYKTNNLKFDLTVTRSCSTKYLEKTQKNIGDFALSAPGLGDDASSNNNSFINTLFVRKDGAAYLPEVTATPSSDEPIVAQLQTL